MLFEQAPGGAHAEVAQVGGLLAVSQLCKIISKRTGRLARLYDLEPGPLYVTSLRGAGDCWY